MGSLERRIRQLEELYHASWSEAEPDPVLAERRAAMIEGAKGVWEKAEREAAEGYPRRLELLEELEEVMKRRIQQRK